MPPVSSDIVASILLPFGYAAGVVKTTLVVFVGLLYVVVVHGICAAVVSDIFHYYVKCSSFSVTLGSARAATPRLHPFIYGRLCAAHSATRWRMVDTSRGRNS